MADERTRNLERASLQGDVRAEAKLLLERVRAGTLRRVQVCLAARWGHGASQRVERPKPWPKEHEL